MRILPVFSTMNRRLVPSRGLVARTGWLTALVTTVSFTEVEVSVAGAAGAAVTAGDRRLGRRGRDRRRERCRDGHRRDDGEAEVVSESGARSGHRPACWSVDRPVSVAGRPPGVGGTVAEPRGRPESCPLAPILSTPSIRDLSPHPQAHAPHPQAHASHVQLMRPTSSWRSRPEPSPALAVPGLSHGSACVPRLARRISAETIVRTGRIGVLHARRMRGAHRSVCWAAAGGGQRRA